MATGVIITNEKFMPFGEELGQSRWWRFALVVQVRPHSIGASGPDVDTRANLTLINMHSPSSQRVGRSEVPRLRTPSFVSKRGPKTAYRHGRLRDSSWDDHCVS